jgi:hypothetical protein
MHAGIHLAATFCNTMPFLASNSTAGHVACSKLASIPPLRHVALSVAGLLCAAAVAGRKLLQEAEAASTDTYSVDEYEGDYEGGFQGLGLGR